MSIGQLNAVGWRAKWRRWAWLWLLAALLSFNGCATRHPVATAPHGQPLPEAIATFDAAWDIINRTYYDTNFNGVNWPRVRAELRPQAAAATTDEELRAVITDMVNRLGQSHFGVIASGPGARIPKPAPIPSATNTSASTSATKPKEVKPLESNRTAGDIGMEVRRLKGEYVVTRVQTNGPAAKAGIRPGWILEEIDGLSTRRIAAGAKGYNRRQSEEIAWSAICQQLKGAPGSTVNLVLRDGQNRQFRTNCTCAPITGTATKLGFLPTFYAHLETGRLTPSKDTTAGLIRFNVWMPSLAAPLDKAVDDLRDTDGMIIDLRGNPGGQVTMVMGFSGHFLGSQYPLGLLRTRETELRLTTNPRLVNAAGTPVKPFAGPVAILVDDCSFSASEIFAGGMQAIGRARVFGQTTAGMALPATVDTLPNGDQLVHALSDFVAPNGTRWEGRGVIPNTRVPLRRARLLAGHDAPLEAAAQWIASEKRQGHTAHPLAKVIEVGAAAKEEPLKAPAASVSADPSLPSPTEILAKYVAACGGREALAKHHTVHFKGSVILPAQGFNGSTEILQARPNKFLTRVAFKTKLLDLAMVQGYDGQVGWMIDPTAGPMLMKGSSLNQIKDQADFEAYLHEPRLYKSLEIVGKEEFDGRPCYKMRSVSHTGAESTEFFDVETGLMRGMISRQDTVLGSIPATTILSDYRNFEGLLAPTKYTIKCVGFDIITQIDSVEFDTLKDEDFALPPQIKGLLPKP